MSNQPPTLHLLCGKIAAGKSTLAASLSEASGTVLLSEDAWLDALFSDQISTLQDYGRCSAKLRDAMGPHVAKLLKAGISVVLDFPANTVGNRAWMRGIIDASGAAHKLHVLDVPDDVCLARLRARNTNGDHPFAVTEEQFRQFAKYYEPPTEDEGFDLVIYRAPPA